MWPLGINVCIQTLMDVGFVNYCSTLLSTEIKSLIKKRKNEETLKWISYLLEGGAALVEASELEAVLDRSDTGLGFRDEPTELGSELT